MATRQSLSDKTVAVLTLIAEGCSYSQIVDGHGITYLDIFAAAEEALTLNESPLAYQSRLAQIKAKYPRAYEKWSETEDADLSALHEKVATMTEMVERFQRQPSAIRSRLAKLGMGSIGER